MTNPEPEDESELVFVLNNGDDSDVDGLDSDLEDNTVLVSEADSYEKIYV